MSHQQNERDSALFCIKKWEEGCFHALGNVLLLFMGTHNEISAHLVSACHLPYRRAQHSLYFGESVHGIQIQWVLPTNYYHSIFNQLKDKVLGKLSQMRSHVCSWEEATYVHLSEFGAFVRSCFPLYWLCCPCLAHALTRWRKYNKQ